MPKIYTKTGDKGETSLVSGTRVSKNDQRIKLYGEVDHLNSTLGMLNHFLTDEEDRALVSRVQHNLFNLGSRLACEVDHWDKYKLPEIKEDLIVQIEKRIDEVDKELSPLKNFILPAGSQGACWAHQCRTTARRVERDLVGQEVSPKYSVELLNRLSDYFFILARYQNKLDSNTELVWNKDL